MSTLNRTTTSIEKTILVVGEHAQDKVKTQQAKSDTQYLDKHDAQRYFPQILSEHKAVFAALKNR